MKQRPPPTCLSLERKISVKIWLSSYYYRVKSEVKSTTKLHGLQELPVYDHPEKILSTQEAITALLSCDLKESSICTRVPFSVEINAAFIVDLNKLNSPKDVLCDDMGVWSWGGSNKRWILVDESGFVTFLKNKPEDNKSGDTCFCVWKRYYSLKASPDVKKMIMLLEGIVPWLCSPYYSEGVPGFSLLLIHKVT